MVYVYICEDFLRLVRRYLLWEGIYILSYFCLFIITVDVFSVVVFWEIDPWKSDQDRKGNENHIYLWEDTVIVFK